MKKEQLEFDFMTKDPQRLTRTEVLAKLQAEQGVGALAAAEPKLNPIQIINALRHKIEPKGLKVGQESLEAPIDVNSSIHTVTSAACVANTEVYEHNVITSVHAEYTINNIRFKAKSASKLDSLGSQRLTEAIKRGSVCLIDNTYSNAAKSPMRLVIAAISKIDHRQIGISIAHLMKDDFDMNSLIPASALRGRQHND